MLNTTSNACILLLLTALIGCQEPEKTPIDTGVSADTDTDTDADADTDTDTVVEGAPTAVDDAEQVREGDAVRVKAALNDLPGDNDLDMGTVTITVEPLNGTATPSGNGGIDYQHDGSETLDDTFSYTIDDVAGLTSNEAVVTLEVGPVNDPPVAVDDVGAVVDEGQAVDIDLAVNDSDADDGLDLAGIRVQSGPTYGSVAVNNDGTVTYTHDGSELASDSFTYTIDDLAGASSNAAVVDISVNLTNDIPTANDDIGVIEPGLLANVDVAANDIDDDDGLDLTTVVIVTAPANGTATPVADGTVDYVHDGLGILNDSFTYTIDDNSGITSNIATVTMSNSAAVAVDDGGTAVDGALTNVDVAGNDFDPDGVGLDLASVVIVGPPVNGTATPAGDGTVDYQHDGLGILNDSFTYTIDDLSGLTSNVATVTMVDGPLPCDQHPQWMPVSCTTPDWVWSSNRAIALNVVDAEANQVLETGCAHAGGMQPEMSDGLCSLTGTGWVTTTTFVMAGCNNDWYHIGGAFTGNCGGHDGDTTRHLVMDINGCYDY